MPATFVPGTDFRVTVGATDYSAQVTGGGVTTTPNVERIRTLTDIVYPQSDIEDTCTVDFLYDEDSGMYGALDTAARAGSSVAVVIVGGESDWTGAAMHVMGLSAPFTAEDGAVRASVDLAGALVYAAVTP